jgi:hypothetical protein
LPSGTLVLRKKSSINSDVSSVCRDLSGQDDERTGRVVYMSKVFTKDIYDVARAALKQDKETFIVRASRKNSDFQAHESLFESHLIP